MDKGATEIWQFLLCVRLEGNQPILITIYMKVDCSCFYCFPHVHCQCFDIRELLNGESEGLLKLPTDKALLDDPEFRRYVELYAKVTVFSPITKEQNDPSLSVIAFVLFKFTALNGFSLFLQINHPFLVLLTFHFWFEASRLFFIDNSVSLIYSISKLRLPTNLYLIVLHSESRNWMWCYFYTWNETAICVFCNAHWFLATFYFK